MKKIISLLLCALMMMSVIAPISASAAMRTSRSRYPVINFRGNGMDIVDSEQNKVYDFDVSSEQVEEICKAVLPLLLKGIVTGNYKEYYEAFEEELNKLYDKAQLDKDGNPKYGTDIPKGELEDKARKRHQNRASGGTYGYYDYSYHYDWRRDPSEYADDIDAFIDDVLAATGKDKVCLVSTCLGGDMLLAYIAKYGTSKLNAITFNSSVSFGSEQISDAFTGDIYLDTNAMERFAGDYFFNNDILSNNYEFLSQFAKTTLSLLNEAGVGERVTKVFQEYLWDNIFDGLFPYIIRASYGTWAGYWTAVPTDKYEEAIKYVFGEKGSEKYEEYSNLIAKIDDYNYNVKEKALDLILEAKSNGVGVMVTSKYGQQAVPFFGGANENGDVWTLCRYSSIGATVSNIATTLSDEYIQSRVDAGYGEYIAPDKQIDASTCLLPDNTWFIKGAVHNEWMDAEIELEMTMCNSTPEDRYDIHSDPERPQFLIWDREANAFYPMTEENCNNETYEVNEQNKTSLEKYKDILEELISWIKQLISIFKEYVFKSDEQI